MSKDEFCDYCGQYHATCDDLRVQLTALRERAEKAERFKAYVHKRLDDAGVPVDPPSVHRESGCRIGGRLDAVFAENDALRASLAQAVEALEAVAVEGFDLPDHHKDDCSGGCEDHETAWLIDRALTDARRLLNPEEGKP